MNNNYQTGSTSYNPQQLIHEHRKNRLLATYGVTSSGNNNVIKKSENDPEIIGEKSIVAINSKMPVEILTKILKESPDEKQKEAAKKELNKREEKKQKNNSTIASAEELAEHAKKIDDATLKTFVKDSKHTRLIQAAQTELDRRANEKKKPENQKIIKSESDKKLLGMLDEIQSMANKINHQSFKRIN